MPNSDSGDSSPGSSDDDAQRNKAYWRANLILMMSLLVIWFVVSFVCGILIVDYLDQFRLFGYKLGFWFSQQGAIYFFVALIFVYAWQMNRLDKRYGVEEE
jgi:putative solute:sodium symporter small subunit